MPEIELTKNNGGQFIAYPLSEQRFQDYCGFNTNYYIGL